MVVVVARITLFAAHAGTLLMRRYRLRLRDLPSFRYRA